MEELLSSLLSSEEACHLGIPLDCLPIFTGPIPSTKEFSHLPSLKRIYLEKSLCFLYSSFFSKEPIKVSLFTWVIGDGLGDFSAQIETTKTLLAHGITPTLISLHPDRMPLSSPGLPVPHFFIPYQEGLNGTWDHIPPVKFPQEVKQALSASHVILQLPTYFPHTQELFSPLLQSPSHRPSYELIGEGGWGHTPRFSPISGSRSLGLRSWEKGLFFPKISSPKSALQVKHLEEALQGSSKICFGYLRNPEKCLLFLQTLLIQMADDPSNLSICLFPIEPLIANLPSLFPFFQAQGIREIKIYYEKSCSVLSIQEKGKVLTLIQTKKLNRNDYQNLLMRADGLIGCRGDGSLSETLSAGKLPFFDFPLHKKPLLEGLSLIANYKLTASHETSQYLQESLKKDPDPYLLGALTKNPKTRLGFLKLYPFLEEHYSVAEFIKNLTLRAACHHFHPDIAFLESQILYPFLQGEEKAFNVLKPLHKILKNEFAKLEF